MTKNELQLIKWKNISWVKKLNRIWGKHRFHGALEALQKPTLTVCDIIHTHKYQDSRHCLKH